MLPLIADKCPICGAVPWVDFGIAPVDDARMEHVCRAKVQEDARAAIEDWNSRVRELTASRALWASVNAGGEELAATLERLMAMTLASVLNEIIAKNLAEKGD